MNGRKIAPPFESGSHGVVSSLEARPVVVEHAGAHVGSSHYGVEADFAQSPQHCQTLVERARAVIDRAYPMTMQVDESSHKTELARSWSDSYTESSCPRSSPDLPSRFMPSESARFRRGESWLHCTARRAPQRRVRRSRPLQSRRNTAIGRLPRARQDASERCCRGL